MDEQYIIQYFFVQFTKWHTNTQAVMNKKLVKLNLKKEKNQTEGSPKWIYGQESPGWISLFKFVIIFF